MSSYATDLDDPFQFTNPKGDCCWVADLVSVVPGSSSTVDMSMYLLPLAMPVLFVHKIVWPDRHDTWSRVHLQARAVSSMRGT